MAHTFRLTTLNGEPLAEAVSERGLRFGPGYRIRLDIFDSECRQLLRVVEAREDVEYAQVRLGAVAVDDAAGGPVWPLGARSVRFCPRGRVPATRRASGYAEGRRTGAPRMVRGGGVR
jgi:hypothetical protein